MDFKLWKTTPKFSIRSLSSSHPNMREAFDGTTLPLGLNGLPQNAQSSSEISLTRISQVKAKRPKT